MRRARELFERGAVDEAIALLRRALQTSPKNADAHLLLGRALASVPRRNEALAALATALELRPNFPPAYNIAGLSLVRLGELDAARKAFEKTIELDPQFGEGHLNLALILAQAGQYPQAAKHVARAIELETDLRKAAYLHYLQGGLCNEQGKADDAAREFETAVASRPDYAEAFLALGVTRKRLLQDEQAFLAFKKAVSLLPRNPMARYRLGVEYLFRGDPHSASEHLLEAHRGMPDDRGALFSLTRALYKAGRSGEYKIYWEKLSQMVNTSTKSGEREFEASRLNSEAIALEKSGDLAGALGKYRNALEVDPLNAVLRRNLALLHCRLGQWDEGIEELKDILRQQPNDQETTRALYIAVEQAEKAKSGTNKKVGPP